MRIGVPAESKPGETRVAATPKTVGQLVGLGLRRGRRARAPARASSFSDEAYAAAGAAVVDGAEAWDERRRPQGQRAHRRGDRAAARRVAARLADLAGPQPRPRRQADRRGRHGARDGRRAAHLARPVARRAVVDGQHRRLPRRHRGGARVRLASSPARSPRPARSRRPRCSSSAPASPGSPRSARPAASARSCGRSTPASEVGEQVESMGAEFLRIDVERRRAVGRRLRQGDGRGLQPQGRRALRRAGQGRRHRHHHRADPRPPGAAAHHRGDGRLDEAGLGRRRHGRRPTAATSPAPWPTRSSPAPTASSSSATPTCPAGCPRRPASCSAPTSSTCSSCSRRARTGASSSTSTTWSSAA